MTNDISYYWDSPWYVEDGARVPTGRDSAHPRDERGALALSQAQKEHVTGFVAELLGMVAAGHADSARTLEYALLGYGRYTLRTEDHVYIQVGIPRDRIGVAVEYTRTDGLAEDVLQGIATAMGVHVYQSLEDGVGGLGPRTLGFPSVDMFTQDAPPLTVDRFIQDYLFKVSRAAEAVRHEQKRLL